MRRQIISPPITYKLIVADWRWFLVLAKPIEQTAVM
jgi:hypothetical protein